MDPPSERPMIPSIRFGLRASPKVAGESLGTNLKRFLNRARGARTVRAGARRPSWPGAAVQTLVKELVAAGRRIFGSRPYRSRATTRGLERHQKPPPAETLRARTLRPSPCRTLAARKMFPVARRAIGIFPNAGPRRSFLLSAAPPAATNPVRTQEPARAGADFNERRLSTTASPGPREPRVQDRAHGPRHGVAFSDPRRG